MLKGLFLTIKGWFNKKAEEATDLRLAGREHIRGVKRSIEEVRDQRNTVSGRGIVLENEIKALDITINSLADAVRHWAAEGDEEKKQRSYDEYSRVQQRRNRMQEDLDKIIDDVAQLDAEIQNLTDDTEQVQNDLHRAATAQVVGRASQKVEGIHKDLRAGALGGAIETVKETAATAEAARRARKADDKSDLLDYKQKAGVKSIDELLGNGQ